MVKWIALVMAWWALVFSLGPHDLDGINARLGAIESRKCTLMAVTTPSGSAWICVELFGPNTPTRSGDL